MQYGERQIVAPTEEPLTLQEALLYVRQDHDADAAVLTWQIKAARERCERVTGRQLVTATWRMTLDTFGCWQIDLPHPPLASVLSVAYLDLAGDTQTVSTSDYEVDTNREPGRIYPAYLASWPAVQDVPDAVTIEYTAGYGAASDVPAEVKDALARCVAHTYGNRGVIDDAALDALFRNLWYGEIR